MLLPDALFQYSGLIHDAASKHGVEPYVQAALVMFESGGNAEAISAAGAVGLGQVMPSDGTVASINWSQFAARPTTAELLDPATNLDWSAQILSSGITRWGTVEQGLAAYLGAIDRKGRITGVDQFTGVTGNQYVDGILAIAGMFRAMNLTSEMYPLHGVDPTNPLKGGYGYLVKTVETNPVWHPGEDENAGWQCNEDEWAPVRARTRGTVRYRDYNVSDSGRGFGWHVWIENDEGRWAHYCHLAEPPPVYTGMRVDYHTFLGFCGRTAGWGCAHLHFEVTYERPYDWNLWVNGMTRAQVQARYEEPSTFLLRQAEREGDEEGPMLSREEAKSRLEQLGYHLPDTFAITERAIQSTRVAEGQEWRGPAMSDEYEHNGRIRRDFTAGKLEYNPEDNTVNWVEVVKEAAG